MSTNDDSPSRRGRRAEPGEPDWRAPNRQHPADRWDPASQGNRETENPYPGQPARENPPPHAAYSAFRRPSYQQPRPELAPPPPQPARAFEPLPPLPPSYHQEPPRALEPQQEPQSYYPEPAARQEVPRAYAAPAPAPYEPAAQIPYGGTGSDLFGGDAGHHPYEHGLYGNQPAYRAEVYDTPQARAPMGHPGAPNYEEPDYRQREDERLFNARIAQESGASRFYLPGEQPQRAPQPERGPLPGAQDAADRYPAGPHYNAGGYSQHPAPHESYEHEQFDHRFPGQESWHGDEHGFPDDEPRSHLPQAVHGDEFDEEFPDEDFEGDDYAPPRKSRKKLFMALLATAVAVAAGGSYGYKTFIGAKDEKGTPLIQADRTPPKEVPDNPGGRQFPHGEKAIYERLTPDGRTQTASYTPPAAPVSAALTATASGSASAGTSLEDRIDQALKRAQSTGDAPAASPAQPGRTGGDQPTVVHSETYRPDGTRADTRPVITPNIVSVENGLPYPFGNAAPVPPAQPQTIPARAAPAPAAPQQFSTATAPAARPAPVRIASRAAPAAAAAVPAAAGGFFVSLKSAPDEKAIQKDIPALTDKYKSVLGEVQITSKIADLGAKGVTYRAVAGPLGSRQEAMDLCQKIKGVGGDKACFVTN